MDKIYDEIERFGDELFLHTITADKSIKSKVPDTDIVRYDVVLLALHDQQQINVNEMLAKQGLLELDINTEECFKNVPNLLDHDSDDEEDDDDWEKCFKGSQHENDWVHLNAPVDTPKPNSEDGDSVLDMFCNFEAEDVEEFLKMLTGGEGGGSRRMPDVIEEEPEFEPESESTLIDKNLDDIGYVTGNLDSSSEDSAEKPSNHQMEYLYKRPKIDWWQTEELIFLRISAYENVKYGLQIASDHLVYG